MQEYNQAVVCNNNQLLEQIADLIDEQKSVEGKAAIGECLALVVKQTRKIVIRDLQDSIDASKFSGAK